MIRIIETGGRQGQSIAWIQHCHDRPTDRGPGNRVVDNAVRVDRHVKCKQITALLHINLVDALLAISKVGVCLAHQCRSRYGTGCAESQRIRLARCIVGSDVVEPVVAVDIRNHRAYELIIEQ